MATKIPECIPHLERAGIDPDDAIALRKIAMTLRRWHELECGDGNYYGSWSIVRGTRTSERITNEQGLNVRRDSFEHSYDDDAKPYIEHHHYMHGRGKDYITYTKIADREAGAKRRLARVMAKYPNLTAYIQTDPRGASLYILRNAQIDAPIETIYNRGVAVYK